MSACGGAATCLEVAKLRQGGVKPLPGMHLGVIFEVRTASHRYNAMPKVSPY